MTRALNRVPEITLYFWLIKIMATTIGETAADFLAFDRKLGLANTSYVMGGILVLVLLNQFRLKRYVPASYWAVVVLVSIVGTLITDRLVDEQGVTLVSATIFFSISLVVVFSLWYTNAKTLAMHSIRTAKRETFYWAAILLTFALGTAAGDLMAEGLRLGYAVSALIFGGVIAAITFAYQRQWLSGILAFWLAYILTRPLGASIGDLLSQPLKNGGLGLGTTGTSGIFLLIIVGLVIFLSSQPKVPVEYEELPHS